MLYATAMPMLNSTSIQDGPRASEWVDLIEFDVAMRAVKKKKKNPVMMSAPGDKAGPQTRKPAAAAASRQ